MRNTVAGTLLVGFVLLGVVFGGEGLSAFGQKPVVGVRGASSSEAFATHSMEFSDGRQQITVFDSQAKCLAVYQIDPRTGGIALKSVRNIGGDLQMEEFNGANPSPKEIRTLLERR